MQKCANCPREFFSPAGNDLCLDCICKIESEIIERLRQRRADKVDAQVKETDVRSVLSHKPVKTWHLPADMFMGLPTAFDVAEVTQR